MSADLSNYDIKIFRGNTYKLDFSYTTNINTGIFLSDRTPKLQIKKSPYVNELIAELTGSYPTGCFGRGNSGDFLSGFGITGATGGISLDYNGVTGDIHIEIDSITSLSLPTGKHVYDLQLIKDNDNTQTTILKGRFEVLPNTVIKD